MYLNSVDGKVSWHGSQKVFSSSCDIRGLFHQLQIARAGIYNLSRLARPGRPAEICQVELPSNIDGELWSWQSGQEQVRSLA